MLVENIDLNVLADQKVRITKCHNKTLENKTGTLTTPFGNHYGNHIGIFLDEVVENQDIWNLISTDEIELIMK